ncbi:MAG: indolepyruvate/phenylpyruvate decarboxylase [Granulosicoccus sp.]|nr:indolepyruvate/phenylpyruvate decarboxylase [Granulosicoccus sp.]
MNISLALLHALKAHGAQEIFGIPGDFALPFFKVIEESSILPLYTLSHEPGIGFAADAAARFHGGLGVAAVTYGAGAFNMVNPVAAAFAEKSPLVVISGAPGISERKSGLLLHHQAKSLDSQMEIFRQITCEQVQLTNPKDAPEQIARALYMCKRYSRPVYIEVPRDQVLSSCEEVVPITPHVVEEEALDACVSDVLQMLNEADSPVLMVGIEIRRYGVEAQVAELANRLGIPVVTSFMGRGLLAEHDAPLLGTYMGVAGDESLSATVECSDALLLLGVIMSDTNLGVSTQSLATRNIIHVEDEQVRVGFRQFNDIPLGALVDRLVMRLDSRHPVQDIKAENYPRHLTADNQSIEPTDIARAVNDLMKQHHKMPIASDMGDCLFTALDIENTELVAPGYYATMGFGIPAGLGVQAATGQRPLILVGDGAFQMTGWELGNCRRYGWNPIILLFNNTSWEMLRTFQPESQFNNLDDWQYAELAKTLGGRGRRVNTRHELADALQHAMEETDTFFLIEIMIKRGVLSNTLRRFAEGIKRLQA